MRTAHFIGAATVAALTTVIPASSSTAQPGHHTDGPAVSCGGTEATIVGTPGDDVLRGTPGPDVIAALAGADVVRGGAGDDIICGGKNADLVFSGRGDDRVIDRQNDRQWDGEGWVGKSNVFVDSPGSDTFRGRNRNHARDMLSFAGATKPLRLTWDDGIARSGKSTDRFSGIGKVIGSRHADHLTGRDKPGVTDTIYGGDGNDVIRGLAGNDLISAGEPPPPTTHNEHEPPGPGRDTLLGGRGADTLLPGGRRIGPGDARIRAQGGPGNDFIGIGPYGGLANGGVGEDELRIHTHHRIHVELATGTVDGMPLRLANLEHHRLDARANGNSVVGTPGDDDIYAENPSGTFQLTGAGGNDVLKAEGSIDGGHGDDQILCDGDCDATGGPGADQIDAWAWRSPTRPRSARGGLGPDRISWSSGPAIGGPGNDVVSSYGDPSVASPIKGGRGDDALRPLGPATLVDIPQLSGGPGADTIDFGQYMPDSESDPRGVTVDLAAGTAGDAPGVQAPLAGIENATGSRFDDTLLGDDTGNTLTGGDGTDSADGRAGSDTCTAETVTNCEG